MKLNLEHPKISGETTVQNAITEVAAIMGEHIKLRRGFLMPTALHGVVSTYLHASPQPGTQLGPLLFLSQKLASLFLNLVHISSDISDPILILSCKVTNAV